MKTYHCEVLRPEGKRVEVKIDAQSVEEVYQKLAADNCSLLSIKHIHDTVMEDRKIRDTEILSLLEQLELLTGSGLNIQNSLEIAAKIITKPAIKQKLSEIEALIRRGHSFGQAMEQVIPSMPLIVLSMLKVGEKSGALVASLNMAITYLKTGQDIRDKVLSASFYPFIVLGLLVCGALGLFFFVLPVLERNLNSGSSIGFVNEAIGRMRVMGIVVIVFLLALGGAVVAYGHNKRKAGDFAVLIERGLVHIPLIGSFLVARDLYSFSFAMEVLSTVNVPVDEALGLVASGLWSLSLRQNLENASVKVRAGSDISSALGAGEGMPGVFVEWIRLSEHTGKPEVAFSQLRKFYEKELNKLIQRITVVIEPAMIVMLGAIMIAVVMNLVVPIYSAYLGGGLQP